MSRTSTTLRAGVLVALAIAFLACSGTPPAGTATPTLPPGATAQPTNQPTQPADTQPGQPTPPPGGGGGAVFPDGNWTAGTAHLVVTGAYQHTNDLTLAVGFSGGGITGFTYTQQDGTTSLTVSVDAQSVTVVITTQQYVGGGGTTADAACSASWSRQEANAAEGTVQCTNAPVIGTGGQVDQRIDIQAQFSATR